MDEFVAGGPATAAAPVPVVRRVFHRPPDLHPYAHQPTWAPQPQPPPPPAHWPVSQWPAAPEVPPAWVAQQVPARPPHIAPSVPVSPFGTAGPATSVWNGYTQVPVPPQSLFATPPPAPPVEPNGWAHPQHSEVRLPGGGSGPLAEIAAGRPAVPWTQTPPREWDFDDEVGFENEKPRRPLLGILLLSLIVVCGWLAWEYTRPAMVAEIPVLNPAPTLPQSEIPDLKIPQALDSASGGLSSVLEEVPFEVRKAESLPTPEVPPMDLLAANEASTSLVKTLLGTGPLDARNRVVAQRQSHLESMTKFFAKHPKGVTVDVLRMATRPAYILPGQHEAALFQMTTTTNINGALLRLISDGKGAFFVDWPLFEETHERRLADFLEGQRSATPGWFHVGLRLTHALDLPEAIREKFVSFELQASADDSVRAIACVELDTSLGRRLVREAQWGTVYLSKLLLQRLPPKAGSPSLVILDYQEPDEVE